MRSLKQIYKGLESNVVFFRPFRFFYIVFTSVRGAISLNICSTVIFTLSVAKPSSRKTTVKFKKNTGVSGYFCQNETVTVGPWLLASDGFL
jgi:hypothetical protein